MSTAENSAPKQRHHGFQPGQSGNPKGKPRGARNKALVALDAIGEAGAEAALTAVVKAAAGGDVRAAELLLNRCWPARKGRPLMLPLPAVNTAESVAEAMVAVVNAVAAGTITPEEGAALAGLLDVQRRAIETTELEKRVEELEAMAPQNRRDAA